MDGLTIMIAIGVLVLIIGGALLIYGIEHHEDRGEKTTTNKIFLFGGVAMVIIGLILLLAGIYLKRRAKNSIKISEAAPQIDMTAAKVMSEEKPEAPAPGGFGAPGFGVPGGFGAPGFGGGFGAPGFGGGFGEYPVYQNYGYGGGWQPSQFQQ